MGELVSQRGYGGYGNNYGGYGTNSYGGYGGSGPNSYGGYGRRPVSVYLNFPVWIFYYYPGLGLFVLAVIFLVVLYRLSLEDSGMYYSQYQNRIVHRSDDPATPVSLDSQTELRLRNIMETLLSSNRRWGEVQHLTDL